MTALQSPAEILANLPKAERDAFIASLTDDEANALVYDWRGFLARPNQIAPDDPEDGPWKIWNVLAGRGFGKTEIGAQWVREVSEDPNARIALVAETAADARHVMVKRILRIFPPDEAPIYESSNRLIRFKSGAEAYTYNATEPDQLRGPEHSHAWCDELAKWKLGQETWDQLKFGLRVGENPRIVVTTTPRPSPLVKAIVGNREGKVINTRGSTYDNAAHLPKSFLDDIKRRYEGTRLGRQEIDAAILDDVPGALWTSDRFHHTEPDETPELTRIVVAIDPSGASGDPEAASDEIGIVLVGQRIDGGFHVLEDASCSLSPLGWARRAVERYKEYRADIMVAERNFGGDMVRSNIHTVDDNVNVQLVTASRGKAIRAEPVAALYEQGKVSHSRGLEKLEEQMLHMTLSGYTGEGSPDRLDAAVWGLIELMEGATYALAGFD